MQRSASVASAKAPSLREQSSGVTATGITISAPNFCACTEGAAGQRHARNAGREAEIIFDPGAGAGLAADTRGLSSTTTDSPSDAA